MATSMETSSPAALARDFIVTLPPELSLKILGYLDATSLLHASQVSRAWYTRSNDDLVWRRLCEQHIARKCGSCGWSLPVLRPQQARTWKRVYMERLVVERNWRNSDFSLTSFPLMDGDESSPVTHVCIDPQGAAVMGRADGEVEVFGARGGDRPVNTVRLPAPPSRASTAFGMKSHVTGLHCDSTSTIISSYPDCVRVWSRESGQVIRELRLHDDNDNDNNDHHLAPEQFTSLVYKDHRLFVGTSQGRIYGWNTRTGERQHWQVHSPYSAVQQLALVPARDECIVSLGTDGRLGFLQYHTNQHHSIPVASGRPHMSAIYPNTACLQVVRRSFWSRSPTIIYSYASDEIFVMDFDTQTLLHRLAQKDVVLSFRACPTRLIVATFPAAVTVYHLFEHRSVAINIDAPLVVNRDRQTVISSMTADDVMIFVATNMGMVSVNFGL